MKKYRLMEIIEYEYVGLGESEEYLEWLRKHADGEDGPHTYEWDIGIAP